MMIPFAEWRPDVEYLNSGSVSDIKNVLWADGSVVPFPLLQQFSEAVGETPLGGFSARASDGSIVVFIGSATALYKLDNTDRDWDDVSKTATTYNATVSNRWRFRQYGDVVIAVNPNDDPQAFTIGSSSRFADLGGSPPRAGEIAVWGDHLALLRLTSDPSKVAWSDTDDITEWTTGNSGSQTFPDSGNVQGATDATNPIIISKRGIWFGTFVPGSDVVFTFQKVHDKRGAAAPYSICSRSNFTFFADAGGFYQILNSGEIIPIGKEQVDRTIFNRIEAGDLAGIIGEIDPFYTRVYWAVKYDSTSNAFDRLIIYDWDIKKWTQIDTGIDILFPLASGTIGVTLEGLDDISASLDSLGISLDSKVWQGGAPVMAALDTEQKLGFFSGMNAEATIVTQEMGDVATVMRLSELYPVVDADNFSEINVSVGARMRRSDAYAWTDETTPSTNTGVVRKRSRARFHKFKLRIAEGADWTHAQGINVTPSPAGTR